MWWCDLIWFIFATGRYRFDQLTYVDRDLHQSRLPRDFYRIPVCTHCTAALLCSGYSCRTHLHFHLFLWQLWGHSGSWRHGHSTHILWDKLIITLLSAIMLINTHTHTHTHSHTHPPSQEVEVSFGVFPGRHGRLLCNGWHCSQFTPVVFPLHWHTDLTCEDVMSEGVWDEVCGPGEGQVWGCGGHYKTVAKFLISGFWHLIINTNLPFVAHVSNYRE